MEIICDSSEIRIDKYLAERLKLTRSAICNMIDGNLITVNGKQPKKSIILHIGDIIEYDIPKLQDSYINPENIQLNIVYEDNDLLVVNKPQGMVVHPAAGNRDGTLVNALLYHCKDSLSGINGVIRPGIVHRIDKDTSGLLIIAKNDVSHLNLANQIKEHSFLRKYVGIVYGHFKETVGIINKPIGRDVNNRKKMAVTDKNSKPAITHYKVLKEYDKYSLVEFRLETGRTHQIRVHASYSGHPIVGDPLYAPKMKESKMFGKQFLHAKTIGFNHPVTNEYLEFNTDIPEYFYNIID